MAKSRRVTKSRKSRAPARKSRSRARAPKKTMAQKTVRALHQFFKQWTDIPKYKETPVKVVSRRGSVKKTLHTKATKCFLMCKKRLKKCFFFPGKKKTRKRASKRKTRKAAAKRSVRKRTRVRRRVPVRRRRSRA